MRVHLEYGRTGLDVELPDHAVVRTLSYKSVPPLSDPAGALLDVLQNPTGSPPLAQLASGRRNACILICDVTRPVPNELMLRPILQTLEESGIARENILILIATGLHRPNEGDELAEMVGRWIADNYRIENHHGQQRGEHDLYHPERGRRGESNHHGVACRIRPLFGRDGQRDIQVRNQPAPRGR